MPMKDFIFDALEKALEIFTSHSEEAFGDVMTNGIRPIADAAKLDRVIVYRIVEIDGVKRFWQVYRWVGAEGGTTGLDDDLTVLSDHPAAANWISTLSKDACINTCIEGMSEDELDLLNVFGVKSVMMAPIFTYDEFWGAVAFQDHTTERYFDEDCVRMLRSAARIYGKAIVGETMKRKAAEAEKLTRAVTEASPVSYVLFNEDLCAIDCNKSVLSIFNCPVKQYFLDNYWKLFSPEKQPDGQNSFEKAVAMKDRAFADGQNIYEWLHISFDGEPLPMENTLTQLKYRGRKLIIAFKYDLRNTKKMTESLRVQSEILRIRLEQRELMSEIAKNFISAGDSEALVNEALAKLTRYLKASRTLIFRIDYERGQALTPAYRWHADNAPPLRASLPNLFDLTAGVFPQKLPEGIVVPTISCFNSATAKEKNFRALLSFDIWAFICVPLYIEGHLWGILSVDQCDWTRAWEESEISFVAMIASVIAGEIMRGIYDKQRADALEKALAASKAKSEFLSNMSHEMRTPLNVITGMAAIGKNAEDTERKDYALNKIEDASTHLLGVINDVLDMSKIEANMLELTPAEFDFENMLQKTVSLLNFQMEEKRHRFSINADGKTPRLLIGDEQRLMQVTTNLLSNAIKFTPDGGEISLNTSLAGEEDGVCEMSVEVADSGIGISPEQQEKLFISFSQIESGTNRKYGGTGLGLAISKRIVNLMGGEIRVESELGKGSRFIFTVKMPRGEGEENIGSRLSADRAGQSEVFDEDTDGKLAGKKLLLVEDMEINREIVIALLDGTGLIIDVAEHGREALDMITAAPDKYDMVFMDLQMPEMDGLEATRRIRALPAGRGKKLPIVAMTANVLKEDVENCLAAGMDDHVGKPIDMDIVFEKLYKYLNIM